MLNYRLNCIKIPINSCIHHRGYIPSGIKISTWVSPSNDGNSKKNWGELYIFWPLIGGYPQTCLKLGGLRKRLSLCGIWVYIWPSHLKLLLPTHKYACELKYHNQHFFNENREIDYVIGQIRLQVIGNCVVCLHALMCLVFRMTSLF